MGNLTKANETLEQFASDVANELNRCDMNALPGRLFHYSDANGVIGILSKKNFWATHANYFEDELELKYAHLVVGTVLTAEIEKGLDAELLTEVKHMTSVYHRVEANYIASFSSDGDLLSQWRSFGGRGKGHCIEIDPSQSELFLKREGSSGGWKIGVARVIYDEKTQAELTAEVIRMFLEIYREFRCMDWTSDQRKQYENVAIHTLTNSLVEFYPRFKRHFFREENEWRIVVSQLKSRLDKSPDRHKLCFRTKQDQLVPYIELDVAKSAMNSFRSVTIGPLVDRQRGDEALRLLLSQSGLAGVEVK